METERQRKFGLIGKDIDYSFSRAYFAKKFEQLNIKNCQYVNFDCPDEVAVRKTIERQDLAGLNVTIPYKEVAFDAVDELSEQARAIGAVNTVVFDDNGKTIGHNTDAYGFEKSLFEHWKGKTDKALILGTGGASKAVDFVLRQHHIHPQWVSRNPQEGVITYADLTDAIIRQHLLIINCTPLGTFPNTSQAPDLPYAALTEEHFLFDLIYNPAETRFLSLGIKQGAKTANGAQMLVHQAEASWALWNA